MHGHHRYVDVPTSLATGTRAVAAQRRCQNEPSCFLLVDATEICEVLYIFSMYAVYRVHLTLFQVVGLLSPGFAERSNSLYMTEVCGYSYRQAKRINSV